MVTRAVTAAVAVAAAVFAATNNSLGLTTTGIIIAFSLGAYVLSLLLIPRTKVCFAACRCLTLTPVSPPLNISLPLPPPPPHPPTKQFCVGAFRQGRAVRARSQQGRANHHVRFFGMETPHSLRLRLAADNSSTTPLPLSAESLGAISVVVYFVTVVVFLPVHFHWHLLHTDEEHFPFRKFVEFISALLSICCMSFLGLGDDVLDLAWRWVLPGVQE